MMSHWVRDSPSSIINPSMLNPSCYPSSSGGATCAHLSSALHKIRECLLRSTVYFKVGCLEKSIVRVLCSWCVCKHFSRRYGGAEIIGQVKRSRNDSRICR